MTALPASPVVLITGCSSGIGAALAQAFHSAGCTTCASARRPEALAPLREAGLEGHALDVTDGDQVRAAVAAADDAFGGVDVLVNNAGYGYLSAVEEGDEDEVRRLFDTNYFGAVSMIKAVLPQMRERGSGHVVNISSMTGLVANPPNAYYSSTKFALEALTEALAKEVGPLGITVMAVEPGGFRTDWAKRSMKEAVAPIDAYAGDVGVRKDLIKQFADHLPGDPRRVGEAVLMLVGLDDPPLRLLLGADVLQATRAKLAELSASIQEWESVTLDVGPVPAAGS